MDRRVLSITESNRYITIEPTETAETHTSSLRERHILTIALSTFYLVIYLGYWAMGLWKR